jgi:hypothetical protein
MSTLIPFESGNLPSYLKNVDLSQFNGDLTAHASSGFPSLSIKGKVFAIVRDGERTILPNPKDPDSPATSIDAVLVKANKGTSKVFYANGYDESGENKKPDCFSNDGTRPDASVENPQAKSCALCPNNQWGSKVSDKGSSKGKACQDSVRMAIAAADMINDPMLLRVPPASIRALGEYGKMLDKRGVSYNMVVTKIGFDMESPTPKLTFKPVGLLSEDSYNEVQMVIASDTVQNILGSGFIMAPMIKGESIPPQEVPAPPQEAPKPKAAAKPKAEPKPEAKIADVDISDLNLDDINFDD